MATRRQSTPPHPATPQPSHAGAPRHAGRAAGRARRSPWPWIVLALAGDRTPVDRAAPAGYCAMDRHAVARAHDHHLAYLHLAHGDLDDLVAAFDPLSTR